MASSWATPSGTRFDDLRVNDRLNDPGPPYVPGTGPAAYQLTPPNFAPPVATGVASWVPFALESVSQFRPEGPYAITSRQFARDYDETMALGVACPDPASCTRTPDQSQTALWHGEQGHIQFNRIARTALSDRHLRLLDEARLFALLNIVNVDAGAAVFDAKYAYNFVRPITAIRNGYADGNPRTTGDPAWLTFMIMPHLTRSIPRRMPTVQGACAVVLNETLGRHQGFDDVMPAVPGVIRHFDSFDDFAADGFVARIYSGMHYRTSLRVGRRLGREVGDHIMEQVLQPLRRGEDCDDDGYDLDDHDWLIEYVDCPIDVRLTFAMTH